MEVMYLTPKQKKMIAMIRARKKMRINDFRMVYSDLRSLRNALERLVFAGILKKSKDGDYFEYNQKNDETILRWLGS